MIFADVASVGFLDAGRVNPSRHVIDIVLYVAVTGEYPQTNVAVNTAFGPGASAP